MPITILVLFSNKEPTMPLELKPVTIECPRCQGRRPRYVMLDDGSIVYCYPPVAEGAPGLVNAVSVGCAIVAVTSQEQLDPDKVQHFVLFTGLNAHFVGCNGQYLFTRVMLRYGRGGDYAPLGGLFATTPLSCPDPVLTLCHEWLGEKPTQVTASGGDWELPPQTT
jgi:hypothetical protein